MSRKTDAPAKFSVDCLVRVRSGVKVPDFPDIPLGGWAGKIIKVEAGNPPCYLIRWNQQTLASMHPVYRSRCERDGLDFEEMQLGEDDLEPDSGGPVILEQPIGIVTPPLSTKDQDDLKRIWSVVQFSWTRCVLLAHKKLFPTRPVVSGSTA